MVVIFKKLWCNTCNKMRHHEIVVSPCCVVCNDYNLNTSTENDTGQDASIVIERWPTIGDTL